MAIAGDAWRMRISIGESDRWHHQSLAETLLLMAKREGLAGGTRGQTMMRIILPLATPGIATAAIYSFTLAWNEYLYAFTLLSDNNYTLSPGITKLIFGDVFLWGQIMAAGVLMSVPLLVLYFVAQRYIVAGLAAGAVKG